MAGHSHVACRRLQKVLYQQMADALNYVLRNELGFHMRKVTHIFRVLGARLLDEMGIVDAVSSTSVLIMCCHPLRL